MRRHSPGLRNNRDFVKFWASQTVSLFGSAVTLVALPLTAIISLEATPAQVGALRAAQWAPFLIIGLVAGVWIDRFRRRPILIASDLGRAVLLGSVPLAAHVGVLTLSYLYVVSFLIGILTVLFEVSYVSFLPSLVGREQLLEGNSRIGASRSAAQAGGPAVGGALVQLLAAPVALIADAFSFLVSATFVWRIRDPEAPVKRGVTRGRLWREIGQGLRVVFGTPILRALATAFTAFNFFGSAVLAIYPLYATRQLAISPALLGLILTVGGVGALAGAVLSTWAAGKFGIGTTIMGSMMLAGAGNAMAALAGGPVPLAASVLAGGQLLNGMGLTMHNINVMSLRQAITPPDLHGRVTATMRFAISGAQPVGAVVGGVLGSVIGLRITVLAAGIGQAIGFLWLVLSPLRGLHEPPEPITLPSRPYQAGTAASDSHDRYAT